MGRTTSFETKIDELQNILSKLENSTDSLEDSINLYEKGMKLVSDCYKILNKAELKITTINKAFDEVK
ncbi:MAG: exodeoxyribonuclease VII small subunit [Clostridia bacterium]|nr:exodeoxyribonuclease VII small subunit [Clostridia bacterium]